MTAFILLASFITVTVLLLLVRSLRNTASDKHVTPERQQQNVELAQQRLAEVAQQFENKQLEEDEYNSLKDELERTLADDLQQQETQKSKHEHAQNVIKSIANKPLIITLCLLIPISAVGIYMLIGTPAGLVPSTSSHIATNNNASAPDITQKDIQTMVTQLEQRLEETPDDDQGWQMLAKTYLALGRYDDAVQALKKVISLTGDDPSIYAALADATALANQGNIGVETQAYIDKALSLQPMHPQALWLAGLAKMQKGEIEQARQHWNSLLPLLASSPDQQQQLKEIIQQSYEQGSGSKDSTAERAVAQSTPTSESVQTNNTITVHVSIDPSIAEKTNQNDTVFVFAKAQQGPPAPLAVKRFRVSDLPMTITLDDNDAMVAQLALSKFEKISVNARISKSGDPIARPGDLESEVFKTTNDYTQTVNLLINKVLK